LHHEEAEEEEEEEEGSVPMAHCLDDVKIFLEKHLPTTTTTTTTTTTIS